MGKKVISGLENLKSDKTLQQKIKGNLGYLCHSASVDNNYRHGLFALRKIFGQRLKKIFSPQHGFVSDVQDDMIESDHYFHPYFQLPIYSLYSETRKPTPEMLEGLDHVIVDLQDVGTRIYTYIYTMTLMMEACAEAGIEVIILDRANPINGKDIEGNMLDTQFASFVGRHPLPVRHGLTMGEIAKMAKEQWGINCDLQIVKMEGWERSMDYDATGLPWVLPSPNLPNVETAFTFVGTVLFEGTNMSEGRGTTKSLEIIGHPGVEPFSFHERLNKIFKEYELRGFALRPVIFIPTFQKHKDVSCGGYQIHITDHSKFQPWKIGQLMCREFYHHLGEEFQWKQPPYEYEYEKMPVDLINGTDRLRKWVEDNGSYDELLKIENEGRQSFMDKREKVLLY